MSDRALSHLRVVEAGSGVAAAHAAKMLADLGADVVKVEPPGGDPLRAFGPFPGNRPNPETSGLFLYLNANKRGVVLDLEDAGDRLRFARMLDGSDLLLHDLEPASLGARGLDPRALRDSHPNLVATSITPFGLSGPHRDYKAYDVNLWNAGGLAFVNGAGPGGDDLPPLRTFGHQALLQAGINAAIASLGALYARDAIGSGQIVEVSAQECVVTRRVLGYSPSEIECLRSCGALG